MNMICSVAHDSIQNCRFEEARTSSDDFLNSEIDQLVRKLMAPGGDFESREDGDSEELQQHARQVAEREVMARPADYYND